MVQSQAIGDASAAIVDDRREGRKPELPHDRNELIPHGALSIEKVVVLGLGYPAARVPA